MLRNIGITIFDRAGLERLIASTLSGLTTAPRILEAGCGSVTNIKLPAESQITGLDISQRELDANRILSERIVGDLQTYEFPADTFDLIVCWDVLEHLPRPEMALERFVGALKPGGLLLIKIPNRNSVKATIVRLTPYWFHCLVYRGLYGHRFGSPGVIPFRTFFRRAIGPHRLEAFAKQKELCTELCQMFESKIQLRFREKLGIGDRLITIGEWFVRIVSFGRLTLILSECTYVFRKKAALAYTPGRGS